MEKAIEEGTMEAEDESVDGDDNRGSGQKETVEMPSPQKTICVDADHLLLNLNSNDDISYLNDGMRLQGKSCSICDKELSTAASSGKALFDAKHPVHCCAHQQRRDCDFMLCHQCYMNKLTNNKDRPTRRSRPNTPMA